MFHRCVKFNQPLNNWNVSNVEDMEFMFCDCKRFNQSLNNWNVTNLHSARGMFVGTKKFDKINIRDSDFPIKMS